MLNTNGFIRGFIIIVVVGLILFRESDTYCVVNTIGTISKRFIHITDPPFVQREQNGYNFWKLLSEGSLIPQRRRLQRNVVETTSELSEPQDYGNNKSEASLERFFHLKFDHTWNFSMDIG